MATKRADLCPWRHSSALGHQGHRWLPEMQRVPDAVCEFGLARDPYNITDMIQPENGEVSYAAAVA